jgi:hypothetical protein
MANYTYFAFQPEASRRSLARAGARPAIERPLTRSRGADFERWGRSGVRAAARRSSGCARSPFVNERLSGRADLGEAPVRAWGVLNPQTQVWRTTPKCARNAPRDVREKHTKLPCSPLARHPKSGLTDIAHLACDKRPLVCDKRLRRRTEMLSDSQNTTPRGEVRVLLEYAPIYELVRAGDCFARVWSSRTGVR